MAKYKCSECDNYECFLETDVDLSTLHSCPIIPDNHAADWEVFEPPNQVDSPVGCVCIECGKEMKVGTCENCTAFFDRR